MRSVPLHLVKALREGRSIAAKLEPRTTQGVAWVCVAPHKDEIRSGWLPDHELQKKPWLYSVRYFEAPQRLVDLEYEISDEEMIHNERFDDLKTLDELDDLLMRLVGDPSKFKLIADWPDYIPY